MTKIDLVKTAIPHSNAVATVGAGIVNVSLDIKEVSSAYSQVFALNCKANYIAKRNARVPLDFDINKF